MACASVSRVLSLPPKWKVSVIYPGSALRRTSIDLPAGSERAARCPALRQHFPAYLVFQPVGFTKLPCSHRALVSSYLTFSSLPADKVGMGGFPFCGTFRSTTVPSSTPSR